MSEPFEKSCYDYCCSAFALFENDELTKIPDLKNPIHSILRPENFSPEFNYTILEPTLRLVTRLLELDALVLYSNILYDGDVRDGQGNISQLSQLDQTASNGTTWWAWETSVGPRAGHDEVKPATRRRSRPILEAMSDMVNFHVEPAAFDDGWDCSAHLVAAHTAPIEGPLTREARERFPRGCRSRITFGRGSLERLEYLTREEARLPKHLYE